VDRTELGGRRRIYLRAVARSAGLESMAALAKQLGIKQSTLTNIQSANGTSEENLRRPGGLLLADIAVMQRVVNSGLEIFGLV